MATHSNILAWESLWTEEPGWLQSMWLQRVVHNLVTKQQQHACIAHQTPFDFSQARFTGVFVFL